MQEDGKSRRLHVVQLGAVSICELATGWKESLWLELAPIPYSCRCWLDQGKSSAEGLVPIEIGLWLFLVFVDKVDELQVEV